jgi:hypothetical protein
MVKYLSIAGIIACDALAAFAGARLLWGASATSVVDGPRSTFLLVIAVTAALMIFRQTLSALATYRGSRPDKSFTPALIAIGQMTMIAVCVVVWHVQDLYYMGWQAAYASMLVGVLSIFGLLDTATLAESTPAAAERFRQAAWRAAALVAAVAGVIATGSVHEWSSNVLNTVALTIAVGLGVGLVARAALVHRASGSDHSPASDAPADSATNSTP